MNTSHWLSILVLAFGVAAPFGAAHAMQDQNTAEQSEAPPGGQADNDTETEDVITVYGKGRVDPGMEAFLAGDYEQAEIEFELNLECAERERMMQDMVIEMTPDVEGGLPLFLPPPRSKTSTGPDGFDRTCENSHWQLYMIGMSQIQLGKYDEAKRNFYKVINTSRDPNLFDAHFRIALLEILDGNLDKAEKRLETLLVLQKRCHRKGDRCEFRSEIDELVAYLEPALANARAEAAAG